jgi:hemin uptake protein HemP
MLVDSHPPKTPASPAAVTLGAGTARQIDSATLLGPQGEVLIVHQQQVYRLRITSLGKLILTK